MIYILLEAVRNWLFEYNLYRFVGVLDQLQFRALAAAGLSFALVLVLGKPTIRWLRRMKIGDSGESDSPLIAEHARAKANVPTMGGVLIVGAILVSTLLLADIRQFYIQLGLIVVVWLAALGGADDWLKLTASRRGIGSRQGLYAWEKLIFQLGIGVLAGWFLYNQGQSAEDLRHVLNLPFQKTYESAQGGISEGLIYLPKAVFIVLACMMIAGMSNAVNISDGMDGLAAGTSAAVLVGAFILCFIAGQQGLAQFLLVPHVPYAEELAVLAGATAGASLGFLWWNCSPASVFMGDTGALALGGVLGYIAVVVRQEIVVLLMSGVFLIEIGSVALQVGYFKLTGGKRLFKIAPYHHNLHNRGWPEQQVVARFWLISVLLVVLGLISLKLR
ncbi:MAG: phospho-N-acetylmuramoyl-pentapeptide-transferase [Phycisphaeraceae bacterium]|nr:phospho-N-acetylmuramoyl-pentapeptide-transferase [Phycisphaeraceae bacterium]